MSFTCERRVGRVIELRVFELRDTDAVNAYAQATLAEMHKTPGNVFICADHRPARIYPAAVTNGLVGLFTKINPRLERAALLLTETNATFAMQVQRIVSTASHAERQVFFSPEPLVAWLGERATPLELARIKAHLAAWSPGMAPPARG